jgi:GT2 family glycosyltransferase
LDVAALERSRDEVLDAIGSPPDLTVIHGRHDLRDELSRAAARRLLSGQTFREVGINELASERGHTAVIAVGDGLSRPDHERTARVVNVAALRFDRLVILPQCIEPSEDDVRDALVRTDATVFCADAVSCREIASLCDARLAAHILFYLDYGAYRAPGAGTLNAFRTDSEQLLDRELPPDNEDISLTHCDPESWLDAIAGSDLVRTDRVAVLIAAAMLGKRVEYAAEFDKRLPTLVEQWLSDLPVLMIRPASGAENGPAPEAARLEAEARATLVGLQRADSNVRRSAPARRTTPPRITAVIVSRNRPRLTVRALDSLRRSECRAEIIVIDNNSSPPAARSLAAACRDCERLRLVRLERNIGAGMGRQLGAELASTELVAFLDDDAELMPGALGQLQAALDAHPEASAVTGTVVAPGGWVMHSGGELRLYAEMVYFGLVGKGLRFDSAELARSGAAGWIPTTAMLAHAELLREFPMDPGMKAYFEDNEWAYRVELARPGSFLRCREALALHHSALKPIGRPTFLGRSLAVNWLAALARFYEVHGRLLGPWLFGVMPLLEQSESRDYSAARLLMELVLEKGTDWLFAAWMNGSLAGLMQVNSYG